MPTLTLNLVVILTAGVGTHNGYPTRTTVNTFLCCCVTYDLCIGQEDV